MQDLAKTFLVLGAVFVSIGLILYFSHKIPFIGRLPGDIIIEKKNFTVYFPLTTSLIVSLILTLVFFIWPRR